MKEKFRIVIVIILFIILVLIGASLIGDLLNVTLKDKVNGTWLFIIHFLLILALIEILFKVNSGGRYILKKFKIK